MSPVIGGGGLSDRYKAILASLGGASVLGVSLTEDPVGFVVAAVMEWAIRGILSFAGEGGLIILNLFAIGREAVLSAGGVAAEPFAIGGGLIGDGIDRVALLAGKAASMAGPLAPLVTVIVVALVVVATLGLAKLVLEAVKWLT